MKSSYKFVAQAARRFTAPLRAPGRARATWLAHLVTDLDALAADFWPEDETADNSSGVLIVNNPDEYTAA